MSNPHFMQAALAVARESVGQGVGGPFGACIVRDGVILATAGNRVLQDHDPTAHAEVRAIRLACAELGTHLLEGAEIYSTTEPCPMCFSAIHWARIGRIVFGTGIADVAALGFNEINLSNEQICAIGGSPVRVEAGYMREECMELLRYWAEHPLHRTY